jgi:asparagine synthase (glutamine-hydrolysing)
MCGFFGVVGSGLADFQAAEQALRSRGPDGVGRFSSENCQLLHTRLAIQDLSPLGHQPMHSGDRSLVLVFNGEIYNAPKLRLQLEQLGCRFRSSSDTEVILQGYERWGDQIWSRLDGIYACALWNQASNQLTLVRDRFGIKPLYCCECPEGLAFASELSALRAAGVASGPNHEALGGYAVWGAYVAPHTPLLGVQALIPGVVMHWRQGSGLPPLSSQSPALGPARFPPVGSVEEAVDGVALRLKAAVVAQTIGDVPVGCFLSGGIDSGVLAVLLQDCSPQPIATLTLGFHGVPGADDETERAAATAKVLGSQHQLIQVAVSDFQNLFDEFIDAIDSPSVDGFNTFLVARAASQIGLKVAFSGLGADEVFGGYAQFAQWQRALLAPPGHSLGGRLPVQLLRRFGAERRAYARRGLDAALDLRQLPFHAVARSERRELRQQRLAQVPIGSAPFEALAWLELHGYLRETLLRDTDAVSMHHGLEVRVPYLDEELVRFCLSLPGALHLIDGGKTLLRRAFGSRLPETVLNHPKTGFILPLAPWLLEQPRFAPQRVASLLKVWGIPRRSVFSSWAYMRCKPRCWTAYWRWVVLAEWLQTADV